MDSPVELRTIERIVVANADDLLKAWYEFFSD